MEIEVVSPIEAEAEVQKYTLVSDDIYVRRYDSSTIPTWYRNMIETLIAQDPTIADVNSALDYLTSVDNGYNVNFANLDTWQASTNALLTTLGSNLDGNTAAIANIQTTYATKTEASAISTNAVQAYLEGGSANAWFTNKISTYASDIASNASDITTLSATLDGHTVSIDTIENISVSKAQNIRSATAPTITTHPLLMSGDLWTNTSTNVVKQWNGSSWVDTTNTTANNAQSTANTAYTWSANASKLITSPDGSVTGWSFGDGSNTKSYFQIQATNFKISDGTTGYTPFSIVGTDVIFNGKVSFNSVTDVPALGSTPQQVVDAVNAGTTTTIDGGKITTGSIQAEQVNTYAITSKSIIGGTIDGASLKGVTITGAIIKASYIDLTDQSYLTNWQSVTDINVIPTQYWSNFALGDNGLPIVDSMGYYRLITSVPLTAPATPVTTLELNSSYALPIYSYDYYQVLAKKPVSNTYKLVPYSNYGWKPLMWGKVWNAYNWSEYWGNDIAFSMMINGNELKIEGYAEKHHYGDLVYNTVYLKSWLNGTLLDFCNASGAANGYENEIPSSGVYGKKEFSRRTFTIGDLEIAIQLLSANGVTAVYWTTNGATTTSTPPTETSDGYNRHLATVGSIGGGISPSVSVSIEVKTAYPSGSSTTVKTGYTGPLLTGTHYENPYTWSYDNCPMEVKYANESYKIEYS